jgi:hypothetical protein
MSITMCGLGLAGLVAYRRKRSRVVQATKRPVASYTQIVGNPVSGLIGTTRRFHGL